MDKLEALITPQSNESLGDYVQRQRRRLGLTQREVALKAEIHPQSYGKVERGQTTQLNQRTKQGLAYALQVPEEYLEALSRGIAVAVEKQRALRFCPQCWTPGSAPDPLWLVLRAQYCFACGTKLQSRCQGCQQPLTSLKHRFCPYCGKPYKSSVNRPASQA
ncbi:double zinc ribbon domain-containing protein [Picosynechococcus sp. PCC 73109]|uniref:double zinc ribbon domain-containing protein n=1 Tax=Picosynechococcus sp. PCC 73109 TaxID=374982 RepID=UPI00074581EB|nr:zinc ribbon domain-containing protein [Picosynechococcus sp. PCC 73109]AMA10849.1 XRE family transcriptional regulator [Picosynechococcus sp. PCC 73109]